LRAVVLHSGAYDLGRLYQETTSAWLRRSLNPNRRHNPAFFSVLPEVSEWTAPILILHGGQDSLIPASQASLLQERLKALGKPHRAVIFPQAGHRLLLNGVRDEVASFLDREVVSSCPR
jgi:dipeptidyl aminopeptidase/acylaminoacyl peptidase